MDWFRFFFGTPARLFVWLVLTGLVTVTIAPGFLALAFSRLISEIFHPLFYLAILYLGYQVMFKGFVGGGKKRKYLIDPHDDYLRASALCPICGLGSHQSY